MARRRAPGSWQPQTADATQWDRLFGAFTVEEWVFMAHSKLPLWQAIFQPAYEFAKANRYRCFVPEPFLVATGLTLVEHKIEVKL